MADASLADAEASGIYQIRNLVNGKRYIGSALKISKRWAEHRRDLGKSRHHSVALQRAWVKYGAESFAFEVVELCSAESLLQLEQRYIDERGDYNICRIAGSALGLKHSDETRQKLREAQARIRSAPGYVPPTKGRKYSREICERMAAPKRGRKLPPFTAQHRARISESKKGNASSLGRVLSDATREKIRASLLGVRAPISVRLKRCTLSDDQVRQILLKRISGMGQREIAEEAGVRPQLVQKICSRKRYEWICPELVVPTFHRKGWKVSNRKRRSE